MLIFGTRVTQRVLATLTYPCEACGNTAAHHVVRRVRKLSLFFVPLIPIGTTHSDTCTYCGRVVELSRQQAESVTARG